MTSFRTRPRFKHTTTKTAPEIVKLFSDALPSTECGITGQVFEDHLSLRIVKEEQHVWSPQLSLDYEINEDGEMEVHGVYGPMPAIWTKYAFGYFVSLGIAFFALIIGGVQLMLGNSPLVLWLVPVSLTFVTILYIMAQTGQKLGAEQTFTLHHFYKRTMHVKVHID